MLQHWDERRIVTPRHEGHRRLYDAATLFDALLVARLRSKGLSLFRAREVLKHSMQNAPYMVILPKAVRFCSEEKVAWILNIEDGPGYVINLTELRAIVTKKMHTIQRHSRTAHYAKKQVSRPSVA
jgi:DNA-binding transcriptional MerR regulator